MKRLGAITDDILNFNEHTRIIYQTTWKKLNDLTRSR